MLIGHYNVMFTKLKEMPVIFIKFNKQQLDSISMLFDHFLLSKIVQNARNDLVLTKKQEEKVLNDIISLPNGKGRM